MARLASTLLAGAIGAVLFTLLALASAIATKWIELAFIYPEWPPPALASTFTRFMYPTVGVVALPAGLVSGILLWRRSPPLGLKYLGMAVAAAVAATVSGVLLGKSFGNLVYEALHFAVTGDLLPWRRSHQSGYFAYINSGLFGVLTFFLAFWLAIYFGRRVLIAAGLAAPLMMAAWIFGVLPSTWLSRP